VETSGPDGRIKDIRAYRPSFVGMVILVCTPFLVFGSAKVYGALATTLLFLTWLALFGLGCRWFVSRPWRVVVVAVLSMLVWLVVVLLAR
jgi:hypothetical protein